MKLYTSDLHFGHKNIIKFDHRPFFDAEEMDRSLIDLWNNRVQPDDEVYILGDLCYRSARAPEWYLRQMKGHKIFVKGNHDAVVINSPKALHYFEGIYDILEIKDNDKEIVLCHYPIAGWNGHYSRKTWHIYGHIHNNIDDIYKFMAQNNHALNAGCMINNFAPASFNELVKNNEIFNKQHGL